MPLASCLHLLSCYSARILPTLSMPRGNFYLILKSLVAAVTLGHPNQILCPCDLCRGQRRELNFANFSESQNPQNIVPTNNSNNKVSNLSASLSILSVFPASLPCLSASLSILSVFQPAYPTCQPVYLSYLFSNQPILPVSQSIYLICLPASLPCLSASLSILSVFQPAYPTCQPVYLSYLFSSQPILPVSLPESLMSVYCIVFLWHPPGKDERTCPTCRPSRPAEGMSTDEHISPTCCPSCLEVCQQLFW